MASIRRRKRVKKDVWIVDYRDRAGVRRLEIYATKETAEERPKLWHALADQRIPRDVAP